MAPKSDPSLDQPEDEVGCNFKCTLMRSFGQAMKRSVLKADLHYKAVELPTGGFVSTLTIPEFGETITGPPRRRKAFADQAVAKVAYEKFCDLELVSPSGDVIKSNCRLTPPNPRPSDLTPPVLPPVLDIAGRVRENVPALRVLDDAKYYMIVGQDQGPQYIQQHGQQYIQKHGQQYIQQHGQQFVQPHGQQFGQPHGQQFGQQFVQPHGQQFVQQHGQQHGQQFVQQQKQRLN